jgi:protein-export membrane protein SecD
LDLTGEGADEFEQITGELACNPEGDPKRSLAIVLDNFVESAPGMAPEIVCNQGISGGEAVITVGGGEEEARELALVLRTGALPIQLEIQESKSVSATLGAAALRAGLLAGTIGLALVCIYLIVLYRGIGVAAIAELAMFGLITIGLIIILGNTVGFALTLAGIAGVIVSIGIAADSSIIYRERYRDELRAGRTIRTAAEKAFSNSARTNLTGNTVSFLAAVVLYLMAVGPVRGFAFTLGLSTLVDTILFFTFTRWLFGLIARSPGLTKSRLMGLRAGVYEPAADRQLTGSGTR